MNSEFRNHKYWLIFGMVFFIIILFLHKYGPYEGIILKVTRSEAEGIAKTFLKNQNFDIIDYSTEIYIDDERRANRYYLRELGNDGYEKIIHEDIFPTYGWEVYFHQNLNPALPQTTYRVYVSYEGNITGFRRNLPDTTYIPSISEEEAQKIMVETTSRWTNIDLSQYALIEKREEKYSKRTDYTFKWEKEVESPEGRLEVLAAVQGNQPGRIDYNFYPPETYGEGSDSSQALFGTVSILFVFFLTQYAIFLFLKKYHQGEVWLKMGRNLFVVYFSISIVYLINYWPSVGQNINMGLDVLTSKIIIFLSTGLLVYFFLALLLFGSWAVGESYARELWPQKLNAIDAYFKGKIFRKSSGISLMKGLVLALGVSFIYLLASIFLNAGKNDLYVSPSSLLGIYTGYSPALDIVTESFLNSMLGSIAITFFIINVVYQKWHNKNLAIIISGLVFTFAIVISPSPPSVNVFFITLIITFLFGCFYGYIFFKFDLLTLLSLHFHVGIIYKGFALENGIDSFYEANFVLLAIALATTPVIYFISRYRNKEFILTDYGAPEHVKRISERERMQKELEIAAKVQLSLLPKEQPQIPGFDIAGLSIPAKEAGGDYYDFVKLGSNKLGIAIGDVSGKGIGAAIYMTLTKGILQAHAEENVSPKVVMDKVNKLLYRTVEKNTFVSMFYAILDVDKKSLRYSRAGHNPGILYSLSGGGSKELKSRGMALGLERGQIFRETLIEEEISLESGDLVVLYTDGITEAMNESRNEYGEERLKNVIKANQDLPAKRIIELTIKDVARFMNSYPQHDDMTMVVLKIN